MPWHDPKAFHARDSAIKHVKFVTQQTIDGLELLSMIQQIILPTMHSGPMVWVR